MKSNIDLQEIAKFDAFAHDWWNTQGSMRPLHLLNPVRLNYIKQHIMLANKKVLDVGCGGGILTEALARENAIVTGIDLSQQALTVAKRHAEQEKLNIRYESMTIEDLADKEAYTYDIITCMEMLEHVPDPRQIVVACAKLLKPPHGFAFFSTINRNAKAYFSAIIGAEYILNLLPKGTHSYARFIRPSELSQWAREARFIFKDMAGVDYSLSNRNFTLGKNVSVNYLACYQLGD